MEKLRNLLRSSEFNLLHLSYQIFPLASVKRALPLKISRSFNLTIRFIKKMIRFIFLLHY